MFAHMSTNAETIIGKDFSEEKEAMGGREREWRSTRQSNKTTYLPTYLPACPSTDSTQRGYGEDTPWIFNLTSTRIEIQNWKCNKYTYYIPVYTMHICRYHIPYIYTHTHTHIYIYIHMYIYIYIYTQTYMRPCQILCTPHILGTQSCPLGFFKGLGPGPFKGSPGL